MPTSRPKRSTQEPSYLVKRRPEAEEEDLTIIKGSEEPNKKMEC
jgi:hypothetical protein